MDAISVTVAKDLMRISAASTRVCILHSVTITQDTSEVSEQLPFQIERVSTDGTGTTVTPEKLGGVGDAAFAGTSTVNLTVDATITGVPLHREAVNMLNGWYYRPTPEERISIPPSGRLVLRLETAPGAALTMTVVAIVEEIG